ncbi:uncharacterized protein F5891DRAFT_1277340 [Suillus fuscotomentosus]|uniref:DUF6699 domain-containing protein n=1 Tax=Suillus fuscotomentosus TaxID=1912939 RepID=A0AAD4EBD5_9AGAM|nr:uncharacterized protein F5891DRAFT_1277340 [Suillus fuscotomentosus]KAG1901864.1 hypothetical protein F5891DRAFT_1277340 [Suillus fuscotomentosus]
MLSTTCPPWPSQWVTCDPVISGLPPAFHNARYAGWPQPPVQLPYATSPQSTARHEVSVVNNVPSHRPQVNAAHTQSSSYSVYPQYEPPSRMNLAVQASPDTISPVDHNIPSLQPWDRLRHDEENMRLIYDHSVPRTVSSNVNETQNAYPHPLLSTSFMPLVMYDLRFPPASLAFPLLSPYAGYGYELLVFVPLTPERPRQIRLISPDFPWTFDIGPDPSAVEEGVTCLDILAALHAALQRPLTDTEWGTAGRDKRASLIRARDRRPMIQPAPVLSLPVQSALQGTPNPVQRERLLLRVDWLGSRVAFSELIKDEAFARSRLIPGGGEPPETWVVRFQRL